VKTGQEGKSYHSFLLRLWRVVSDGKRIWLSSLEDPNTGERRSFASLEELLAYLKEQIRDEN
jgi:hypothetical protein